MKNIYKTLLVWLLTAIISSIIFGMMLGADEAGHTGRLALDTRDITIVSAIAAVVCLGLSLPATILYHFLAVRLYSRWENTLKIKMALGFYAIIATFLCIFLLGIAAAESLDRDFLLLVVPFGIGSLASSLLFSYRPTPQEQTYGEVTAFSDITVRDENSFPKETHAILIFIAVLMLLWNLFNLFKGRFYGGGLNLGFSVLFLGVLVAGIILFGKKEVRGWYLLFGYFIYGTLGSLISLLNLIGHYRSRISGSYLYQTVLVLMVCNLAPLVLLATPQMVRYFRVEKNKSILVGIIAALLILGVWIRFWSA